MTTPQKLLDKHLINALRKSTHTHTHTQKHTHTVTLEQTDSNKQRQKDSHTHTLRYKAYNKPQTNTHQ